MVLCLGAIVTICTGDTDEYIQVLHTYLSPTDTMIQLILAMNIAIMFALNAQCCLYKSQSLLNYLA